MASSIPSIKLPFSTIAELPVQAQVQIRRNFEELQKNIIGASTAFDAVIDGALTTSVPASHTYKNLTDLVANETLVTTKVFSVAVVGRPSSNIIETASVSLNGPIALFCPGATAGSPGGDGARAIWDLHGFTVTGSGNNWISCANMEIINGSGAAVTTAFPSSLVYLDNCIVRAGDSIGTARRFTNIGAQVFMQGGTLYDFGTPSTGRAWLYGVHWFLSALNSATAYNPAQNGDFYFVAGTIGKSANTPLGFTHTTTNRCFIEAFALVNQIGSEGGSNAVPVSLSGTGDFWWKVAGTGGDTQFSLQFTIAAGAGNVSIDSDSINRLTCSGNSSNATRSLRLRMRSFSGSTLDVTGPASVDVEWAAHQSTAGNVIFRGTGVRATVRLGSPNANPWVALTACTDSIIEANLNPPGSAGSQAYAIDAASARCILIINNQHANFSVASTNAGTNCVVINETGVTPSGAAGGSLAGTYPNPTFAGRDSSVDKINQDLLPASLLGNQAGMTSFPALPPTGAAGGSLTGTYPNPTFVGRDSSVDKINQDILPADLVGPVSGVTTTPTPAPGSSPTGAAGGSLNGTYPNPTFAGRDSSVDAINKDMLPGVLGAPMYGMYTVPPPLYLGGGTFFRTEADLGLVAAGGLAAGNITPGANNISANGQITNRPFGAITQLDGGGPGGAASLTFGAAGSGDAQIYRGSAKVLEMAGVIHAYSDLLLTGAPVFGMGQYPAPTVTAVAATDWNTPFMLMGG